MRSSPSVRFDLSTASSSHTASPSHSPFSTTSAAFSNGSRKDATEKTREDAKAELMKQLSSGSVTGFVSGILLSVFSRTLVLLLGVGVVVVQVCFFFPLCILYSSLLSLDSIMVEKYEGKNERGDKNWLRKIRKETQKLI